MSNLNSSPIVVSLSAIITPEGRRRFNPPKNWSKRPYYWIKRKFINFLDYWFPKTPAITKTLHQLVMDWDGQFKSDIPFPDHVGLYIDIKAKE